MKSKGSGAWVGIAPPCLPIGRYTLQAAGRSGLSAAIGFRWGGIVWVGGNVTRYAGLISYAVPCVR
jgi:hypothetical protein